MTGKPKNKDGKIVLFEDQSVDEVADEIDKGIDELSDLIIPMSVKQE